MIVFKAFLRVVSSCKWLIILYTSLLIFFAYFNLKNSNDSFNFSSSKPDILVINNDVKEGVNANLLDYLNKNMNVKDDVMNIDDALFYRDVNLVLYINKGFRDAFLNSEDFISFVSVKTTGDYQASLANMLLERYLNLVRIYRESYSEEKLILDKVDSILSEDIVVNIDSDLDSAALSNLSSFYNFLNYSILATLVFVVALVLSSFRKEDVFKRTLVSSTSYKRINRELFISNLLLVFVMWFIYVVLSYILFRDIIFSTQGLIFLFNSLIFSLCAFSLAFLIANIVKDKNSINGIVTVISLGSSFLCGAFVPADFLPSSVVFLAHVFPSYYYINTNDILMNKDIFQFANYSTILFNIFMIILFSVLFAFLANKFSKLRYRI